MLLAAAMILVGFIALIWSANIFASTAASIEKDTGILAIAIFVSRMRSKPAPGRTIPGHTPATLLVSSYALYYYSLRSAL